MMTAKAFLKRRLVRVKSNVVRFALSYSSADLADKLASLGFKSGDAVVLHAAFGNFTGYDGKADHLLDCILDVIGPRGHLFMMSMEYSGALADYLKKGSTFDVRRTPSHMGLVSECFRRRKGVLRSANPAHPVLAWGPRAQWVVEGHEKLVHSCGAGSPFEKMLELDTRALLFDLEISILTFSHYLEHLFQQTAPTPLYAREPLRVPLVTADNAQTTYEGYAFSKEIIPRRNFVALYDAFERAGHVRRDRIGNTALTIVSLRELLAFARRFVESGGRIYDPQGMRARVDPSRGGPARRALSSVADEVRSGRAWRDVKRTAHRVLDRPLTMIHEMRLPAQARAEVLRDRKGLPSEDPGAHAVIPAAIDWICVAQDRSATRDGGVARHFSLVTGWSASYPETTGYIVPTMLELAGTVQREDLSVRARRMLDWLLRIQFPEGAFPGGMVGTRPVRPVTFNTGQILIGLSAGARYFSDAKYTEAMHRAARWLVETQDADGCWRQYTSPFVRVAEHTYDTHTAWGLLEAASVSGERRYAEAALANVRWAITQQRTNGWIGRCCLEDTSKPLTHTIGYAQRGIIEAYRFSGEKIFLESARAIADRLLSLLGSDGYLAGRFSSDWRPAADWVCVTGTAQIAQNWLSLYQITANEAYRLAGRTANAFVRRTVRLDGEDQTRGGIKGSFPVDGDYCKFEYPNWAAKFAIDANRLELKVRER